MLLLGLGLRLMLLLGLGLMPLLGLRLMLLLGLRLMLRLLPLAGLTLRPLEPSKAGEREYDLPLSYRSSLGEIDLGWCLRGGE